MPVQEEVIQLLKDMGIRDKYKVLVGGGPVTADWSEKIGADGYANDAVEGVKLAKRLLES
jgi:methanogenic corrinoid protein MtbC1